LQFAYAIGHPEPLSVHIDTRTHAVDEKQSNGPLLATFKAIKPATSSTLNLSIARFIHDHVYGHFGKSMFPIITWE